MYICLDPGLRAHGTSHDPQCPITLPETLLALPLQDMCAFCQSWPVSLSQPYSLLSPVAPHSAREVGGHSGQALGGGCHREEHERQSLASGVSRSSVRPISAVFC